MNLWQFKAFYYPKNGPCKLCIHYVYEKGYIQDALLPVIYSCLYNLQIGIYQILNFNFFLFSLYIFVKFMNYI